MPKIWEIGPKRGDSGPAFFIGKIPVLRKCGPNWAYFASLKLASKIAKKLKFPYEKWGKTARCPFWHKNCSVRGIGKHNETEGAMKRRTIKKSNRGDIGLIHSGDDVEATTSGRRGCR